MTPTSCSRSSGCGLTPDGVCGRVDGAWIVDRHHRHHPAARHWHPGNAPSFGFKPDRESLRQGVRGFVVGINAPEPFEIAIGDRLAALPRLVKVLE